jgi:branched-chain amino acid transport system substrate-binding protein
MSLTPDVATRVARDCRQQGYHGLFGVTALIQSQVDALPGVHYGGGIFAFPWWVDAAPVRQFRSVMSEYEPKADIRSPYMTVTWTTLELFRKALGKPSGAVTPASVTDAYYRLKGETLGGLLPQPLTMTRGKGAPPVNCFWLFSYTSGQKDPVALTYGRNGNGGSDGLASSCSS